MIKYRYYLQYGEDEGTKTPSYPIYKDDVTLDYEQESGQQFFRKKLNGKINFVGADYTKIKNAPFDTEHRFIIEKSNDFGLTYNPYFVGKFYKTDCTINEDDRLITTTINTIDEYEDVLNGLDNEYNLKTLAPEIERINLQKRPLIQVYVPNDRVVSCFLGGSSWEQDCEQESNEERIVNNYRFTLTGIVAELHLQADSTPQSFEGTYVGKLNVTSVTEYSGNLFSPDNNSFHVELNQYRHQVLGVGWVNTTEIKVVRTSDAVVISSHTINDTDSPRKSEEWEFFVFPHRYLATYHAYNIYARYLCDVDSISGVPTMPIPDPDIVPDNRNYRRVIGFNFDIINISGKYSTTPTEYGLADNGKYFAPPYSISGQKYYPIGLTTWRYASLWFAYHLFDEAIEKRGRKTYTLRDSNPISSVIKVLLNEIAPNITHEATPDYSQFLYGDVNPINLRKFRLYITQKTNIINGEYKEPAEKTPITLQNVTEMLRKCFDCYWHIEGGKFHVEHIKYYKNGGSYTQSPVVGTDLTTIVNPRNGKPLSFATSEYNYDKAQMAERYQYEWMDDCTQAFDGEPIEVISPYVNKGKTESINVANFTSDIDLMLLNPSAMSNDGFALFACVDGDALANPQRSTFDIPSSGTNAITTPYQALKEGYGGKSGVLDITASGGGTFTIVFIDADGNVISEPQEIFDADGTRYSINVTIPDGAVNVAYRAAGSATIYSWGLAVESVKELPYIEQVIDNVTYRLQNGIMAFAYLQPQFLLYNMPAPRLKVNDQAVTALGTERLKKQNITYPVGMDDADPMQLVKTDIGNGQVEKLSINLSSRTTKTTLKYDTN